MMMPQILLDDAIRDETVEIARRDHKVQNIIPVRRLNGFEVGTRRSQMVCDGPPAP